MPAHPAYRIETPRLVLRCYAPEDHAAVGAAIRANLDHLRPWMPWAVSEPVDDEARIERLRLFRGRFDLGQDFPYALFDRASGAFLGASGLHPRIGPDAIEIGYWIDRAHEGRGLVTEAVAALTRVAIELHGLGRVEIRCDPSNVRSAAIPRRLGYTLDGTLRRNQRTPDGVERDTMIWSLLHDELTASAASAVAYAAYDAAGRVIGPT